MLIFIVHHKGKLNGAKKISREILNLAEKEGIKYVMSPYPHEFRLYSIGLFIITYFRFVYFHLKHRSKENIIYFSGSNNTAGFVKDLPLLVLLNLLCRNQKKTVHFHSSTNRLDVRMHPIFTMVYRRWTHIYLGENLVPIVPPQTYHIINNFVDFPLVKEQKKRHETLKIGFYGTIVGFKGIHDYNKIASNYLGCDSLSFSSAGIGDSRLIDDQIHHYGELMDITEKVKYLSSIDILIYPSYWDAQPLSILEAFHCNTVVIGYDTGTISEMIAENDDVLAIGDIDGIISRVDFYKNNSECLEKVKLKNYQQILNKFNRQNFAHRVDKFVFK